MLLGSAMILGGCIAFMLLNDKTPRDNNQTREKPNDDGTSIYDSTFIYWADLPLQYQFKYMEQNLDLQQYQYLLTNNGYINAKKVANIAEKLGKEFVNINKIY